MENQPNNEEELEPIKIFQLEFNTGLELTCNPQNTSGFLHRLEPKGDHLFVHQIPPSVEHERADYIFREQVGEETFNRLLGRMALGGWVIIESEDGKLNDDDREAYEEFLALKERGAFLQQRKQLGDHLPPEHWISPRQELTNRRAVEFLMYLAQRGLL
jgi:hypothetical protein